MNLKGKRPKTILTLSESIAFQRNIYAPSDTESTDLLLKNHGLRTVVPLDIAFGIDRPPV